MKETNKKTVPMVPENQGWYQRWHGEHHAVIHWGIFLIVVVACYAMLAGRINDWLYSTEAPGVVIHLAKPSAHLSLNPQEKTITVGDTFTTDIVLDTGGTPVDGVDIYSLHYDSNLLEVIDDLPDKSGVQITPGLILGVNAANIVSERSGTIKFSAVSEGGKNFVGKGVLGTIHFKALSAGTAYLKFDFSSGSTIDSNAAYRGKDQLVGVVDATYTIEK